MRKLLLFMFLSIASSMSYAGQSVGHQTLIDIYQRDNVGEFEFEFRLETGPNGCGGIWYRVLSDSESTASRKFAILLTAFTTEKKISFYDHQICQGDRATVGWVRFS